MMLYLTLLIIVCADQTLTKSIPDDISKKFMSLDERFLMPIISSQSENIVPYITVENYLSQRLDNFDVQNDATFQQRYFMNGEYFQPGGPVIVLLGGDNEITPWRLGDMIPSALSKVHNGYLFYLEHRFYGKSVPTETTSVDNLRYLTVDQALADIANFINHITSPTVIPGTQNSPIIVIGSFHAGSLAAWFCQKYSHFCTAGAWASSAPILSKVQHFEYKEAVGNSLRIYGSDSCYNRIENGFKQMEEMVSMGKLEKLTEMFNICNVPDTDQDIDLLFSSIAQFYSQLVENENNEVYRIKHICNFITNEKIVSDAEAVAHVWNKILVDQCHDLNYNQTVRLARDISPNSLFMKNGERQRFYQTCSQIGFLHSFASEKQPFGHRCADEFYYQYCMDVFGDRFNVNLLLDNVERHNTNHGGLNLNVKNVIFTHGELDPWRTVGIQQDLNENSPAFVIEGASQSKDLGLISEFDSPHLMETKIIIIETINKWIENAYENNAKILN